jgi:uncharacterized membrane protein YidH (DUF202 family)
MKPEASSQSNPRPKTELLSDALILIGCLVVLLGLWHWSMVAAIAFLGTLLIVAGCIVGSLRVERKGKTE